MPREAHGTVVQLAESHGHPETRKELLDYVAEHGANTHPRWWADPAPPTGHGTLRRVVLRTPSLPSALSFFAGVLQGDVEHETADVGRSRVAARRARPPGDERRRAPGRRPPRGRRPRRRAHRHRHPLHSGRPSDGRSARSALVIGSGSSRTMRRTASCTAWSASDSCTPRAVTSARRRGGMRAMRSWRTPT